MTCFARSRNLSNTMTTLRDGLLGLFVLFLGCFPLGRKRLCSERVHSAAVGASGAMAGTGSRGRRVPLPTRPYWAQRMCFTAWIFWFALRSTEKHRDRFAC